jgi:hypothetical protein
MKVKSLIDVLKLIVILEVILITTSPDNTVQTEHKFWFDYHLQFFCFNVCRINERINILEQTKYHSKKRKTKITKTIYKRAIHHGLLLLLLVLCGDVELNPGPTGIHSTKQECFICHKKFNRIKSHIRASHQFETPEQYYHETESIGNYRAEIMNTRDKWYELSDEDMTLWWNSFLEVPDKSIIIDPAVSHILKTGQNKVLIEDFCRKLHLEEYKYVIATVNNRQVQDEIPVAEHGSIKNVGRNHWSLLVLNTDNQHFYHFDSLSPINNNHANDLARNLSGFFTESYNYNINEVNCYKQEGMLECGACTLHNMDLVCSQIKSQTFINEATFMAKVSMDSIYNQLLTLKENNTFSQKRSNEVTKNNKYTSMDDTLRVSSEDEMTPNPTKNKTAKCDECGKMFLNDKGLSIHISKSHYKSHRSNVMKKYVKDSQKIESSESVEEEYCKTLHPNNRVRELEEEVNKWQYIFEMEQNDEDFLLNVDKFSTFLSNSIYYMPGPKHPAFKYYNLRKQKKEVSQNSTFKKSSNPERKTKNERKKRKEKYDYELIQFEYYNRRRKAVRKIIENDNKGCQISLEELHNGFGMRFSNPNNKYASFNSKTDFDYMAKTDSDYDSTISEKEILQAMNGIKIDTAPGPDKVLMRSVKIKGVSKVLCSIYNRLHRSSLVPQCFRKARTVLIYKGGEANDFNNWRPITICSVLRRIFEKIMDKRIKEFVSFSQFQGGFTNIPGTHINTQLLNEILHSAKHNKNNCSILFLDIAKAYDNIGHLHLASVLRSLPIPQKITETVLKLQTHNVTQIETMKGKTKPIMINRGVMQGSPLSPTLYNLCINHILEQMSEQSISEEFGFKVCDDLPSVSVLGFADDTVLIGKNKESAVLLYNTINHLFSEIGLNINPLKTKIINIERGILLQKQYFLESKEITSIGTGDKIKYLGVNFSNEIIFDSARIIANLNNKIEKLTCSPFLKTEQKMFVLVNYIWPTLIYPFQTAPLSKISLGFFNDIDQIIRTTIKEILEIPNDTPSSFFYSGSKFKGLGLTKSKSEAILQHLNICRVVKSVNNPYLEKLKRFDREETICLEKLNLTIGDQTKMSTKALRNKLQEIEYEKWCELPYKGKGVVLFQDCQKINKRLTKGQGLTETEFKYYLKMINDVASVRSLHGRSKDGHQCRHCSDTENYVSETLAHVLGQCPFSDLLRNTRHHSIRKIIADEFRKQNKYEVFEEVTATAVNGSTRRCDIIVIDRTKNKGIIIDPTVRFENKKTQPEEVHVEKTNIYSSTIPYYEEKYGIEEFKIYGLMVGSRGTIPLFLQDFWNIFKLDSKTLDIIALTAIKYSVKILKNHLYSKKDKIYM